MPEQIDNYPDILIQSIEKEIIQVIYQNDTSSITIRKGVGMDDISGNYAYSISTPGMTSNEVAAIIAQIK